MKNKDDIDLANVPRHLPRTGSQLKEKASKQAGRSETPNAPLLGVRWTSLFALIFFIFFFLIGFSATIYLLPAWSGLIISLFILSLPLAMLAKLVLTEWVEYRAGRSNSIFGR